MFSTPECTSFNTSRVYVNAIHVDLDDTGKQAHCVLQKPQRNPYMNDPDDIVARLDRAADEVPEALSALLLEAADTIRMLRELVTEQDELWLESAQPKGSA